MTSAREFLDALREHRVDLVAGVPCSYFAGPIRLLEQGTEPFYVPAANEGGALAAAAGAGLAGRAAVVLAQNSGFGNLVNPLTSLVLPYRIPVLVMMSMRGWPTASAGEPQHRWMGRVVPQWLESLEIPHWTLSPSGAPLDALLSKAQPVLDGGGTAFVLVEKGAIEAEDPLPSGTPVSRAATATSPAPTRDNLVDALLAEVREENVLSTTGYLSRTLFNRGDRDRNFYMQGSMGHLTSLALGAALVSPDERFVLLDGDGAVLMHMGALAVVGHHAPRHFLHVVFDNGFYASTGGQAAVRADFAAVARGCGYRHVHRVATASALGPALRRALALEGPALLVVAGGDGGELGERASSALGVEQVAERFARVLQNTRGGDAGGRADCP
ncbi:phosphonopyruvate decarboxylase [Streptomyces griseus]|uniref:phosphonopyruvate decarboxylase n=1 Tax=Streptomyces griseus TaxID=1911 RepID=UPI00067B2830|nr:phosphonopyruvate decarboxylase [Streptomyces griseus]